MTRRGVFEVNFKERLATLRPAGKKRRRLIAAGLLTMCLLLCGFVWDWAVNFTMEVLFPLDEAVDSGLIFDFSSIVDIEDLNTYLTEPVIAEQITAGVHANLSANVYNDIEIPDMTEESLGSKIIRIIFDRILS